MSDRYALDASALLCLLNAEPGADRVEEAVDEALISAVNYSEVVAKIIDRGGTPTQVAAMLDPLHLRLVDFDHSQAVRAGELRAATRQLGLSFGDRACLALASSRGLKALTTDQGWRALAIGLEIEFVR